MKQISNAELTNRAKGVIDKAKGKTRRADYPTTSKLVGRLCTGKQQRKRLSGREHRCVFWHRVLRRTWCYRIDAAEQSASDKENRRCIQKWGNNTAVWKMQRADVSIKREK